MRTGGVRPRRIAILPRQVAVEAREEVWVILLTPVDMISLGTPEDSGARGWKGWTHIHRPKGYARGPHHERSIH